VHSPEVSIICPTWNCAELLREAVLSVVNQTFSNWELIIVNNFSTDNTMEVITSFKDQRIHVLNFNNNGVIAASRNVGIDASKGRFIAFIDSDDYWMPEKLRICVDALTNNDLDLVCHGERHFQYKDQDVKLERDVFYGKNQPHTYESLLYRGNFLSTSAVVIKREKLLSTGSFNTEPSVITAEDYDLWLRLFATESKFLAIHQILGGYRIHQSSASASVIRHYQAVRKVVTTHFLAKSTKTTVKDKLLFTKRMARIGLSSGRAITQQGTWDSGAKFAFETVKILGRCLLGRV